MSHSSSLHAKIGCRFQEFSSVNTILQILGGSRAGITSRRPFFEDPNCSLVLQLRRLMLVGITGSGRPLRLLAGRSRPRIFRPMSSVEFEAITRP